MYIFSFILASALLISDNTSTRVNDDPFVCGAIFAIVAKAYSENGDRVKGDLYQEKFDILFVKGEENFIKTFEIRRREKNGARQYMQEYVDSFSKAVEGDDDLFAGIFRMCERKFP